MAGGKLGMRVLGIGAGLAGKKAATSSWKVTTGRQPPKNGADPDVNWREAAAWAAMSGAMGGLVRLLATRKVSGYWRKSTGNLPAGVDKSTT